MTEIERILRENGLTDEPSKYDGSIHSWRCEYPDRYGECSCFAELVADLRGEVRLIVLRLADRIVKEAGLLPPPSGQHPAVAFLRAEAERLAFPPGSEVVT